jgi:hypothetical protein
MGSLNAGQAGASDGALSALNAPTAKPGQTMPPDNPIGAYTAARLQVAHALFPGLTDYLTKPPPPAGLVANAQGELPSTDNPDAVPALLDVAAMLGPAAAKGAGEGVLALARGAQDLAPYALRGLTPTRLPAAPNLLADAYHNTFSNAHPSIMEEGLNPGSYATTSDQLSPLQAQIDLALPPNRGLPNTLLRIDLDVLRKDGYEIPPVTPVARKYNMPGGGSEMQFPYRIHPRYIQVVPKQ